MKFKPVYFYGLLFALAAAVLIIVSQQNQTENLNVDQNLSQNLPDDEIHKQLKNQGMNQPSKENVSESYKQRLSELKSAVEKNPGDTLALRKYADFLTASHKMDEAIMYYEKILNKNPKRADIHFSLSLIYYNKNDLIKAEEQNRKVLAFEPSNQMALYNLGAIEATRGNSEKAREFWNEVISIDPESETGKLAAESLERL